jgi:hypothetical protein
VQAAGGQGRQSVTAQVTDELRQRLLLRRRRCRSNAGPERTGRTQGSVSVSQELHEATALLVSVLFCLRFGLCNVHGTCPVVNVMGG